MNRCDLYRATYFAFTNAYNFDIYRPSKNGNCPLPLATRTLIKSGWGCGDSSGSITIGPDFSGKSIDECETLCREES